MAEFDDVLAKIKEWKEQTSEVLIECAKEFNDNSIEVLETGCLVISENATMPPPDPPPPPLPPPPPPKDKTLPTSSGSKPPIKKEGIVPSESIMDRNSSESKTGARFCFVSV